MKFKLIFIGIAVFLLCIGVCFTINFNSETNNPNNPKIQNDKSGSLALETNIIDSLTDDDFNIKDENNYIKLGGRYGDLKTDEKITKTRTANEKFTYDVYVYENFNVTTEAGGNDDSYIGEITLLTSIIQTSRGIRIGDSISDVFKKYGSTDYIELTDTNGYYMYNKNSKYITFYVDDIGKVTGVKFELN